MTKYVGIEIVAEDDTWSDEKFEALHTFVDEMFGSGIVRFGSTCGTLEQVDEWFDGPR